MAGPTSKSAWTGFERFVAAAWGTVRNPLSGANNRQGDGRPRPGDIILDGYDALVECKYRAAQAHHPLFRAVQKDAQKHGINPEHCFLYTKVKREQGALVVMDAETFHTLVLPHLKPLLRVYPEGTTRVSGSDEANVVFG